MRSPGCTSRSTLPTGPAFAGALESRARLGQATARALAQVAKERGISYEAACLEPARRA